MRHFSRSFIFAVVAVPGLAVANENITFDGTLLGNDYNLTFDHKTEDVFVGSLLFNVAGSKTDFTAFCVDLTHVITNGETYTVDPISTSSLSSGNGFRLAGDILDAGIASDNTKNGAAALQIAIWKAVYGNSFSLSGVSSSVSSLATADYNAGLKYKGTATYLKETNNKGQSQITTTPEPASMAVMGLGALGLILRRRRS